MLAVVYLLINLGKTTDILHIGTCQHTAIFLIKLGCTLTNPCKVIAHTNVKISSVSTTFSPPAYKNVTKAVLLFKQAVTHRIPNTAFNVIQVCPKCKYLNSHYLGVTIWISEEMAQRTLKLKGVRWGVECHLWKWEGDIHTLGRYRLQFSQNRYLCPIESLNTETTQAGSLQAMHNPFPSNPISTFSTT